MSFPVSLSDGSVVEIVHKEILDASNPIESTRMYDADGNVYVERGGLSELVVEEAEKVDPDPGSAETVNTDQPVSNDLMPLDELVGGARVQLEPELESAGAMGEDAHDLDVIAADPKLPEEAA